MYLTAEPLAFSTGYFSPFFFSLIRTAAPVSFQGVTPPSKGVIIALDDDQRIRRALDAVPSLSLDSYRYEVDFKLVKA